MTSKTSDTQDTGLPSAAGTDKVTTSPSPGVSRTTTGAAPAGPDREFTQNTGLPPGAAGEHRVGAVEGAEGVSEAANVLPLYEVVLIKPHTHGREDFPIGATIRVNAAQRDWLIEQGVISADTLEN